MSQLPILPPFIPNRTRVANLVPFTYRDSMTMLEKIENLQKYVVEFVPEVNAAVAILVAEFEAINESQLVEFDVRFTDFVDHINALVALINNKTGPVDTQHITLTANRALSVDALFPDNHAIVYEIEQTGAYTLTPTGNLTGTILMDTEPGTRAVIFAIPKQVAPGEPGQWYVYQPKQEMIELISPLLAEINGRLSEPQLANDLVARTMDGSSRYFPERWYFGPKGDGHTKGLLYMEYHGHFLAQRFSFGGIWDASIRTAPTIEVFPASPFARPDLGDDYTNKVGANAINPVSCIQAYAFGHGDTDSRSYFCIEPHLTYDSLTKTYGGEHVFSSWASGPDGPGVLPVQWRAGNIDAFNVSKGGIVEIQRQLVVGIDSLSNSPFTIERQNANDQPAAHLRQYSNNTIGSHIAMSKARGTKESPTLPQLNDILGRVSGGASTSAGIHTGAEVRFLAQENWRVGEAQGSRVSVLATAPGSSGAVTVAQFDVPTLIRNTSARLIYWDGSTLIEKRVSVGAENSGGTGYRSLLVSN